VARVAHCNLLNKKYMFFVLFSFFPGGKIRFLSNLDVSNFTCQFIVLFCLAKSENEQHGILPSFKPHFCVLLLGIGGPDEPKISKNKFRSRK